jgi:hypothetical protein
MGTGTDVAGTPARGRPSATRSSRWCRATWLLLVTTAAWLTFVISHPLFGGFRWLRRLPGVLPWIGYVIVPVLLLIAVPTVGRIRAPVPVIPRRIIVAAALFAFVIGALEVGRTIKFE